MAVAGARRRIAILGGGQAALTAALQLTDPANPDSARNEVTIHQIGWRLGGKGATGRPVDDPWAHMRIEEHGFHAWFGFYDNSFRQIRAVYAELDRDSDLPLSTFEEAFEPFDRSVYVEQIEGRPLLWTVDMPRNVLQPGEGGLLPTPLQLVYMVVEALEGLLAGSGLAPPPGCAGDEEPLARAQDLLRLLVEDEAAPAPAEGALDALHAAAAIARPRAAGELHPLVHVLHAGRRVIEHGRLPRWLHDVQDAALWTVCALLWVAMEALWLVLGPAIDTVARTIQRRVWIIANLGYTAVTGAIRDGVIDGGFDVLNDVDFRAWLHRNCFEDGGAMLRSPLVEGVYIVAFAYPGGAGTLGPAEAIVGDLEAGTALKAGARTLFTYKGAFGYHFRAGTADTCYGPAYEVLRARGVDVRFLHRVRDVEVRGGRVVRVTIGRQAELLGEAYDPLVDVRGLPCWPSTPLWGQLVDGERWRALAPDFECPSQAVRELESTVVLELGTDFDDVVLGISIAALPSICPGLVASQSSWRAAVDSVKTVRTQAVQLWLARTSRQLGFPVGLRPVVNWDYSQESALNAWADLSELLAMEEWPADAWPRSLAYFCSTLADDGGDPFDPYPDPGPATAAVFASAVRLLERGAPILLPRLTPQGPGTEVDWRLLVDLRPRPGHGAERLKAQWIKANVAASERYVLSVVDSSRHRLGAHDPSCAENLYLAGDWTRCAINAGCMEAATISGMLCSNALCGYPPRASIVGVDF
jgi:uncharacterized protein with NAD-binding domain and iron-sulfur cluster